MCRELRVAQKSNIVLGIEKFGKDYFTLYKLRHCFASRHTESKTSIVTIAEMLGHGDLKTLQIYRAHAGFENKAEAIKRVDKAKAV